MAPCFHCWGEGNIKVTIDGAERYVCRPCYVKHILPTVGRESVMCDCGCHVPEHYPFDCRAYAEDKAACCDTSPVHDRTYPGEGE